LFGSAAQDRLRADSDIDIAYMSNSRTSPYDISMLSQRLADKLGREVDLVHFQEASSVFKAQIVEYGIVLFEKDEFSRKSAYMYALKEYARLNEERQQVLRRINPPEGGGYNESGHSAQ
jgi:predicted nucleotidyltransferase